MWWCSRPTERRKGICRRSVCRRLLGEPNLAEIQSAIAIQTRLTCRCSRLEKCAVKLFFEAWWDLHTWDMDNLWKQILKKYDSKRRTRRKCDQRRQQNRFYFIHHQGMHQCSDLDHCLTTRRNRITKYSLISRCCWCCAHEKGVGLKSFCGRNKPTHSWL